MVPSPVSWNKHLVGGWGMVEKGEGGARTCSLEEEAGRALRRTLSSPEEEEEEPAESGGC